jgi:repressor LexA
MTLTVRQREVLDYVRHVELQRGSGPTTREVQQHFGFKSQTAAVDHIRTLERKGALQKIARKARALTTSPPKLEVVHVPVFGSIPAGVPELIEQEPDGFVMVDTVTAGISARSVLFATHVRGDSMIGAHVLDGDCAVFEVREPLPGQIVAALIDGETTLKRYVQEKGRPFLRAENPKYPDLIPVGELRIQGVLVHLQRNCSMASK